MSKEKVIRKIKENYQYLSFEFGVAKIGLFGSFAKGSETENSDIDLLVEFTSPIGFKFYELVEYLEKMFGRKVDVITMEGLNNIRIDHIAENIREKVIYV